MQEIEFSLQHLRISAWRQGNETLPVVIALHGWLDNAASFIPLARYLPDCHLIAIDLPGHGFSQHRSQDANYHLMDWVQNLHQLIELQSWPSVTLLGHSLGGIIGSLYAAAFPERVERLISIEAFGPLSEPESSSPDQLRRSIESRLRTKHSKVKHPSSREVAIKSRKMAGDLSQESASLLVSRNLASSSDSVKWRTDRNLRTVSSLRLTEPQAQAFMASIECPVLSILADEGFEKVRNNFQKRQHLVSQLHVERVRGGHHCHMDYPEEVAQVIQRFILSPSGMLKS